jgi:transcription elongation GreA/GreB family factor
MDAPMAKALMKKTEGDEVTVKRPKGTMVFTIVRVWYGNGE